MSAARPASPSLPCQENEDVYDRIADGWVMARSATIEQQVAGARFLLAVLTCWQFEYPLTEEVFIEDLQRCVP